jgi:hypothetical protein
LFFSQEPAPEVGIKEIVEDGEVLGERRVGRGRWIGGEEGAGGSEIDEGKEFFQVEIGQATDTDDVAELQRSFASEESAQGAAAQAHGGVRLAVAGAYDLEEVLERPSLFVDGSDSLEALARFPVGLGMAEELIAIGVGRGREWTRTAGTTRTSRGGTEGCALTRHNTSTVEERLAPPDRQSRPEATRVDPVVALRAD